MISSATLRRFVHLSICLALLLTGAFESNAATLTASSLVTAKSFYLGESTSSAGYKIYFNSYDGISGYSRSQSIHSGEALSFGNGIFTYVSDYDIYVVGHSPYDGPYSPIGYGTISFAIPTTDSDGDGLIDFLDISKYINKTVTGYITEYVTGKGSRTYTASCSFVKGLNTGIGEFTFTTSVATVTGFYDVQYGTATVSYDTEAKTIKFSGTSFGFGSPFTPGASGTATATYQILSATSIKVNAFTYTDAYYTKRINAFTMTRVGNKFIATGSMQDGHTYSSWVDYKDFVLTITDSNDTDGDGIPDLSDSVIFLGPVITSEPASQTVAQGDNVTLSVTATSPYAMTYQWYLNDGILEGKTSSTLTLNDVQAAQAGGYKVVVSSNGKTKTSQVATLAVRAAPRITITPLPTTIVAGRTLTLTVGATGSPAPTFEWYRNGTLLPGYSTATLTINSANVGHSGNYVAKAINTLGHDETQEVKVVVTTGIIAPPTGITLQSLQSGGFPLEFQLENGKSYRIEYSTNLIYWIPLTTFTSTGTAKQFLDAAAANNPRRFYRLVRP